MSKGHHQLTPNNFGDVASVISSLNGIRSGLEYIKRLFPQYQPDVQAIENQVEQLQNKIFADYGIIPTTPVRV